MHELSAAQSIADAAVAVARANKAKRIKSISVEVGQLAFIPAEHLQEAFGIASKGTMAEGAKLVVKTLPATYKCLKCGASGPLRVEGHHHTAPAVECPKCNSQVELVGSTQCVAKSVDLEV